MRSPKDFFQPLAVGAPRPLREIPFPPSRMIHFFPPHLEKVTAKLPEIAPTVDILLGNLEDPTVTGNVDLLTDAKGKAALRAFLKARTLPTPVDTVFVKALQEVLSGLQKVVVRKDDLHAALLRGGAIKEPYLFFIFTMIKIIK